MAFPGRDKPESHNTLRVSPLEAEMLATEAKRVTALRIGYLVGAIAILPPSAQVSDISLVVLAEGGSTMAEYISRYCPPDFSNGHFYLEDILETVAMDLWGILRAALFAALLAVLWQQAECIRPVAITQLVNIMVSVVTHGVS